MSDCSEEVAVMYQAFCTTGPAQEETAGNALTPIVRFGLNDALILQSACGAGILPHRIGVCPLLDTP